MDVEMYCNNYCGILLLSFPSNILLNIFLSKFSPYVDEIIGNLQYGFHHSGATTDELFYIPQFTRYWRKKWECNETVHQLLIDFMTAHDLVGREVLYNILIDFGISTNHFGKHLLIVFLSKIV
jgi:hypothetical protein